MEINITLSNYEIANLIHAMKFVNDTGDWYQSFLNKLHDGMHEQGIENWDMHYNPGMDVKTIRRHLDLMEMKQRHS
jgi:hypothetical protein